MTFREILMQIFSEAAGRTLKEDDEFVIVYFYQQSMYSGDNEKYMDEELPDEITERLLRVFRLDLENIRLMIVHGEQWLAHRAGHA